MYRLFCLTYQMLTCLWVCFMCVHGNTVLEDRDLQGGGVGRDVWDVYTVCASVVRNLVTL